MIRLTKHSLTQTGSFLVETESMTLAEKDSQITFTVALPGNESSAPLPGAPTLTIGDWLMEEDEPGKGLVWRVRSIEDDYVKRIRTVTAEHIIQILKDRAMFGEVNPDDMGGSSTVCTARQAIEYALSKQSDWVLGTFGYNESAGYSFNGDSLLEAINTVCSTLEDPWWSYNVSSYPFTLHINPKNTTPDCEMRMSRNISTIKRSIDASQLYTRIYPIGKDDLHISGNYLSRNTDIYGVIHKVETNQSIDSASGLETWARLRLKKHSVPSVTVSISGLELSGATGEPLDHLRPGKMCQVPLPEYGTVILETLTKMVWRDKKKEPQAVTVTLANEITDLATIIKESNDTNTGGSGSGGRRGGSASKKQKEEDHAWMVDTTDHVALVAEAVAGEGAATDWSRVAEVVVDGEGVHQRVTRTEDGLVTAEAAIDVLEDSITLKVSKGDVSTQLAVECGNVSITGGNLTVDGYVTAAGLDAAIANLNVVHVKSIQAASGASNANLSLHSVTAMNSLYVGTNASSVELISSGIADAVTDLKLAHTSGTATYTLQKKTISSHSSWTDVGTFSKAATLSVQYGGDNTVDTATYTVTGTPAENFPGGNTTTGSFTVHQSKAAAYITDENGTIRARINNPQYGNGWAAAYGEVDLPTTSSTAASFNVKTPKSTTDGGADTETYTISSATNDIAVVKNLAGTVVARLEHGKYTAGISEGESHFTQATVTLQGASESVYIVPSSGGTEYYKAGTATTYYQGTSTQYIDRGDSQSVYVSSSSGSYYLRGDSVTRYTAGSDKTYYLRNTTALKLTRWGSGTLYPNPSGTGGMNHEWYYVDSGGTSYYTSNGSANVTLLGDSGTYYKGNGTRLASATRYKGNGTTVYGRGASVSVTPISGTALKLTATTRYKAGTTDSTTYYTKNS